MTTKERWTVYPLLLLAIGLAVRGGSGSTDPTEGRSVANLAADTVVCKELAIVGEEGVIIVHAGRVKGGGGGRIEIRDASGVDTLSLGTSTETRDGSVEFFDAEGTLVGRFGPRAADAPHAEASPGPPGDGN